MAAVNVTFVMIFGRTDLRLSLSRAKFDDDEDFEVRKFVDPPKPRQISEKQNFLSEIFAEKNFRHRKMKRRESSETRFGKVSCQSEPCSSKTSSVKIFDEIALPYQSARIFICTLCAGGYVMRARDSIRTRSWIRAPFFNGSTPAL